MVVELQGKSREVEPRGFLIKPCEQHENPTELVNNMMVQSFVHSLKLCVLRYFSVTAKHI